MTEGFQIFVGSHYKLVNGHIIHVISEINNPNSNPVHFLRGKVLTNNGNLLDYTRGGHALRGFGSEWSVLYLLEGDEVDVALAKWHLENGGEHVNP